MECEKGRKRPALEFEILPPHRGRIVLVEVAAARPLLTSNSRGLLRAHCVAADLLKGMRSP